jgi:hypothetical protein
MIGRYCDLRWYQPSRPAVSGDAVDQFATSRFSSTRYRSPSQPSGVKRPAAVRVASRSMSSASSNAGPTRAARPFGHHRISCVAHADGDAIVLAHVASEHGRGVDGEVDLVVDARSDDDGGVRPARRADRRHGRVASRVDEVGDALGVPLIRGEQCTREGRGTRS